MKQCKQSKSSQSEKSQRLLADLKIATLAIPETLSTRKRLIEVVCDNLEVCAGFLTDLKGPRWW